MTFRGRRSLAAAALGVVLSLTCASASADNYIIHGENAGACEIKHQARIESWTPMGGGSYSVGLCGGSLIDNNWVVTAGHCVEENGQMKDISTIKIFLGYRGANNFDKEVKVVQQIAHPYYNHVNVDYDVALYQLSESVQYTSCIQPIYVPAYSYRPADAMTCQISGYGRTETGSTSEALQKAATTVWSDSDCETTKLLVQQNGQTAKLPFDRRIHLCASGTSNKGMTTTCQGDSGGPLACNENGYWVLHGITSYGATATCMDGSASVYARVSNQDILAWVGQVGNTKSVPTPAPTPPPTTEDVTLVGGGLMPMPSVFVGLITCVFAAMRA